MEGIRRSKSFHTSAEDGRREPAREEDSNNLPTSDSNAGGNVAKYVQELERGIKSTVSNMLTKKGTSNSSSSENFNVPSPPVSSSVKYSHSFKYPSSNMNSNSLRNPAGLTHSQSFKYAQPSRECGNGSVDRYRPYAQPRRTPSMNEYFSPTNQQNLTWDRYSTTNTGQIVDRKSSRDQLTLDLNKNQKGSNPRRSITNEIINSESLQLLKKYSQESPTWCGVDSLANRRWDRNSTNSDELTIPGSRKRTSATIPLTSSRRHSSDEVLDIISPTATQHRHSCYEYSPNKENIQVSTPSRYSPSKINFSDTTIAADNEKILNQRPAPDGDDYKLVFISSDSSKGSDHNTSLDSENGTNPQVSKNNAFNVKQQKRQGVDASVNTDFGIYEQEDSLSEHDLNVDIKNMSERQSRNNVTGHVSNRPRSKSQQGRYDPDTPPPRPPKPSYLITSLHDGSNPSFFPPIGAIHPSQLHAMLQQTEVVQAEAQALQAALMGAFTPPDRPKSSASDVPKFSTEWVNSTLAECPKSSASNDLRSRSGEYTKSNISIPLPEYEKNIPILQTDTIHKGAKSRKNIGTAQITKDRKESRDIIVSFQNQTNEGAIDSRSNMFANSISSNKYFPQFGKDSHVCSENKNEPVRRHSFKTADDSYQHERKERNANASIFFDNSSRQRKHNSVCDELKKEASNLSPQSRSVGKNTSRGAELGRSFSDVAEFKKYSRDSASDRTESISNANKSIIPNIIKPKISEKPILNKKSSQKSSVNNSSGNNKDNTERKLSLDEKYSEKHNPLLTEYKNHNGLSISTIRRSSDGSGSKISPSNRYSLCNDKTDKSGNYSLDEHGNKSSSLFSKSFDSDKRKESFTSKLLADFTNLTHRRSSAAREQRARPKSLHELSLSGNYQLSADYAPASVISTKTMRDATPPSISDTSSPMKATNSNGVGGNNQIVEKLSGSRTDTREKITSTLKEQQLFGTDTNLKNSTRLYFTDMKTTSDNNNKLNERQNVYGEMDIIKLSKEAQLSSNYNNVIDTIMRRKSLKEKKDVQQFGKVVDSENNSGVRESNSEHVLQNRSLVNGCSTDEINNDGVKQKQLHDKSESSTTIGGNKPSAGASLLQAHELHSNFPTKCSPMPSTSHLPNDSTPLSSTSNPAKHLRQEPTASVANVTRFSEGVRRSGADTRDASASSNSLSNAVNSAVNRSEVISNVNDKADSAIEQCVVDNKSVSNQNKSVAKGLSEEVHRAANLENGGHVRSGQLRPVVQTLQENNVTNNNSVNAPIRPPPRTKHAKLSNKNVNGTKLIKSKSDNCSQPIVPELNPLDNLSDRDSRVQSLIDDKSLLNRSIQLSSGILKSSTLITDKFTPSRNFSVPVTKALASTTQHLSLTSTHNTLSDTDQSGTKLVSSTTASFNYNRSVSEAKLGSQKTNSDKPTYFSDRKIISSESSSSIAFPSTPVLTFSKLQTSLSSKFRSSKESKMSTTEAESFPASGDVLGDLNAGQEVGPETRLAESTDMHDTDMHETDRTDSTLPIDQTDTLESQHLLDNELEIKKNILTGRGDLIEEIDMNSCDLISLPEKSDDNDEAFNDCDSSSSASDTDDDKHVSRQYSINRTSSTSDIENIHENDGIDDTESDKICDLNIENTLKSELSPDFDSDVSSKCQSDLKGLEDSENVDSENVDSVKIKNNNDISKGSNNPTENSSHFANTDYPVATSLTGDHNMNVTPETDCKNIDELKLPITNMCNKGGEEIISSVITDNELCNCEVETGIDPIYEEKDIDDDSSSYEPSSLSSNQSSKPRLNNEAEQSASLGIDLEATASAQDMCNDNVGDQHNGDNDDLVSSISHHTLQSHDSEHLSGGTGQEHLSSGTSQEHLSGGTGKEGMKRLSESDMKTQMFGEEGEEEDDEETVPALPTSPPPTTSATGTTIQEENVSEKCINDMLNSSDAVTQASNNSIEAVNEACTSSGSDVENLEGNGSTPCESGTGSAPAEHHQLHLVQQLQQQQEHDEQLQCGSSYGNCSIGNEQVASVVHDLSLSECVESVSDEARDNAPCISGTSENNEANACVNCVLSDSVHDTTDTAEALSVEKEKNSHDESGQPSTGESVEGNTLDCEVVSSVPTEQLNAVAEKNKSQSSTTNQNIILPPKRTKKRSSSSEGISSSSDIDRSDASDSADTIIDKSRSDNSLRRLVVHQRRNKLVNVSSHIKSIEENSAGDSLLHRPRDNNKHIFSDNTEEGNLVSIVSVGGEDKPARLTQGLIYIRSDSTDSDVQIKPTCIVVTGGSSGAESSEDCDAEGKIDKSGMKKSSLDKRNGEGNDVTILEVGSNVPQEHIMSVQVTSPGSSRNTSPTRQSSSVTDLQNMMSNTRERQQQFRRSPTEPPEPSSSLANYFTLTLGFDSPHTPRRLNKTPEVLRRTKTPERTLDECNKVSPTLSPALSPILTPSPVITPSPEADTSQQEKSLESQYDGSQGNENDFKEDSNFSSIEDGRTYSGEEEYDHEDHDYDDDELNEEEYFNDEDFDDDEYEFEEPEEGIKSCTKPPVDFTLHTILEESCEESDYDRRNDDDASNDDPSGLEKYFFYGLGNGTSESKRIANDESEFSDSFSESSSSIFSESLESNDLRDHDNLDPADLASSRLEQYFVTGLGSGFERQPSIRSMGEDSELHTDESGSVGSDSEGSPSPEQPRKKLLRPRGFRLGMARSHGYSSDRGENPSDGSHHSGEDGDGERNFVSGEDEGSTESEEIAFDKVDGQFDTIKRRKKKKSSGDMSDRRSDSEKSENRTLDIDSKDDLKITEKFRGASEHDTSKRFFDGGKDTKDKEIFNTADLSERKYQSRDSGFIGSSDDLLKDKPDENNKNKDSKEKSSSDSSIDKACSASTSKEGKSSKRDHALLNSTVAQKLDNDGNNNKSEAEERNVDIGGGSSRGGGKVSRSSTGSSADLPPFSKDRIKVSRKDSFNWSSDEETNIMMNRMRAFFRSMLTKARENVKEKTTVKSPQMLLFEAKLTSLMKKVPDINDEQVKEIVEYLSSEETWSDSYDSSDYNASDFEGTYALLEQGTHPNILREQISASCQQIIQKFDQSREPSDTDSAHSLFGGRAYSESSEDVSASGKDSSTLFMYQRLLSTIGHMRPESDRISIGSGSQGASPPLLAKVFKHIGTSLVELMHEVSGGSETGDDFDSLSARLYSKTHKPTLFAYPDTSFESDGSPTDTEQSPASGTPKLSRRKALSIISERSSAEDFTSLESQRTVFASHDSPRHYTRPDAYLAPQSSVSQRSLEERGITSIQYYVTEGSGNEPEVWQTVTIDEDKFDSREPVGVPKARKSSKKTDTRKARSHLSLEKIHQDDVKTNTGERSESLGDLFDRFRTSEFSTTSSYEQLDSDSTLKASDSLDRHIGSSSSNIRLNASSRGSLTTSSRGSLATSSRGSLQGSSGPEDEEEKKSKKLSFFRYARRSSMPDPKNGERMSPEVRSTTLPRSTPAQLLPTATLPRTLPSTSGVYRASPSYSYASSAGQVTADGRGGSGTPSVGLASGGSGVPRSARYHAPGYRPPPSSKRNMSSTSARKGIKNWANNGEYIQ